MEIIDNETLDSLSSAEEGLQKFVEKSAEAICFEVLGSNLSDATKIFLIQMLKSPEIKKKEAPEPKPVPISLAREEILQPNGWNTRGSKAIEDRKSQLLI